MIECSTFHYGDVRGWTNASAARLLDRSAVSLDSAYRGFREIPVSGTAGTAVSAKFQSAALPI